MDTAVVVAPAWVVLVVMVWSLGLGFCAGYVFALVYLLGRGARWRS